jgi:hypothetical protein
MNVKAQRAVRVVSVAAAVAIVGIAITRGGGEASPRDTTLSTRVATGATVDMPPWPTPPNITDRVAAAGLSLGPMGTAQHFHVHLDVSVNGRTVPVAANIGVDPPTGMMSGLHTHDTSGIVHVEAAHDEERFTLGQLFSEWDVHLSRTQIGGLSTSGHRTLIAYVEGVKRVGDPARIVLRDRQEIALVYGPAASSYPAPSHYDFPASS